MLSGSRNKTTEPYGMWSIGERPHATAIGVADRVADRELHVRNTRELRHGHAPIAPNALMSGSVVRGRKRKLLEKEQ